MTTGGFWSAPRTAVVDSSEPQATGWENVAPLVHDAETPPLSMKKSEEYNLSEIATVEELRAALAKSEAMRETAEAKIVELEKEVEHFKKQAKFYFCRDKKFGHRLVPTDIEWRSEELQDWAVRYQKYTAHVNSKAILLYHEQDGPNCAIAAIVTALSTLHGGKCPWLFDEVLEFFRGQRPDNDGLKKEKPSTACVGNQLLLQGIKHASDSLNLPVKVIPLIGPKCSHGHIHGKIHVSEDDSQDEIKMQWAALTEKLRNPDSVCLFHTENHYCIIYGYRTWLEGDMVIRQVLTSPTGQRPKAWRDFDVVRQNILRSKGPRQHRIFCIEKEPKNHDVTQDPESQEVSLPHTRAQTGSGVFVAKGSCQNVHCPTSGAVVMVPDGSVAPDGSQSG